MLGHGQGRVFRSKEYKAWLKEAHGEWLIQRSKLPVKKIEGRYRLCIYASPPVLNRRRDAGNLEKATSDFLVMVGIIEDDHLAKSVFTEWDDEPSPTSGIRIEITPYP